MTEFDDQTLRRMGNAVRKSEKSREKAAPNFYNPSVLKYVLAENVVLADTVKAVIWYIDDSAVIDRTATLHFKDNLLKGELSGTSGPCHWFQGQYWFLSKIPTGERLEKFQMYSDWVTGTGKALAVFTLMDAASPDRWGIVEDPLLIFADQIGYGNSGLSIRTGTGRHFVIQAACKQTVVTPPDPQGACSYSGDDGTTCAQTSEADCASLGGSWAVGGTCP